MRKTITGAPLKLLADHREKTITFVYVLGLVHWYLFMQHGQPQFKGFDWIYIYQWLDVVRQAFSEGTFPFHASYFLNEYQSQTFLWGDRYFATPYIIASPQILLLSFLSVPTFMTTQVLLLYTLGFLGVYLWIKKLNLPTFSSVVVLLLACFNGSIVARMGVGHLQLTGYMLVPWFFWFMHEALAPASLSLRDGVRFSIRFAFFLLFLLLQGSLHVLHQMALVSTIVFLFFPKRWPFLGISFVLLVILGSYLIIPNALFGSYSPANSGQSSDSYLRVIFGGYGIPSGGSGSPFLAGTDWWPSIVNTCHHILESLILSFNALAQTSWEYSLYVGVIGLALMLFGAFGWAKDQKFQLNPWQTKIFFSTAIVASLSIMGFMAKIYGFAQKHIFAFPAIDRLPSRLMIYPFTLLILLSASGLGRISAFIPIGFRAIVHCTLGSLLAITLWAHSYGWSVTQTDRHGRVLDQQPLKPYTAIYVRSGDEGYKQVVILSYGITLLSIIGAALGLSFLKPTPKKK